MTKLRERERESNNLFSFKKLLMAYYECRKNKRKTVNAAKFEMNFESELIKLEKELLSKTYEPGRSICFAISDPKLREIFAADFRDRVVHHLLIGYLEPIFEKKFIFHSYACRKEKGTHLAISYLQKAIKSACSPDSKSPSPLSTHSPASTPFRKGARGICIPSYYLQIDIKSFFMNIHKDILYSIITRHVKNPDILWLARIVIMNDPTLNYYKKGDIMLHSQIPPGKSLFGVPPIQGLPIGNLTSQFFANVYMNEVDQYIKHSLKVKHYFRYVDDLLILHKDREQLKSWLREISHFLEKKLKLELHPQKIILQKINQGINFAGYIVKPDNILVRNKTVRRLKSKLYRFNENIIRHVDKDDKQSACDKIFCHPYSIFDDKTITAAFQNIFSAINSYFGMFKPADTYILRKHLYEKHFGILRIYLRPANDDYDYFIWNER